MGFYFEAPSWCKYLNGITFDLIAIIHIWIYLLRAIEGLDRYILCLSSSQARCNNVNFYVLMSWQYKIQHYSALELVWNFLSYFKTIVLGILCLYWITNSRDTAGNEGRERWGITCNTKVTDQGSQGFYFLCFWVRSETWDYTVFILSYIFWL